MWFILDFSILREALERRFVRIDSFSFVTGKRF